MSEDNHDPSKQAKRAAAAVHIGYKEFAASVSTRRGEVRVGGRVAISGNNAVVSALEMKGPGAGSLGASETRAIGRDLAIKIRLQFGVSGDITFTGLRFSGAGPQGRLGRVTFRGS